ncbi:hypothetical protein [Moraxella lacunata]|uniref:hypothetical protein n=1 Tax=Moraxella lacunata TaxID=477 RepID=UPI003EE13DA4
MARASGVGAGSVFDGFFIKILGRKDKFAIKTAQITLSGCCWLILALCQRNDPNDNRTCQNRHRQAPNPHERIADMLTH